jgi:hypothetical protein
MSDATQPEATGIASPQSHWKRRGRDSKSAPIPHEQAARQGAITSLAFLVLGPERAIAFLNADNAALGGRPLALATASEAGHANVEAELGRMSVRDSDGDPALRRLGAVSPGDSAD